MDGSSLVPDAVQRVSGAPLIRDRQKLRRVGKAKRAHALMAAGARLSCPRPAKAGRGRKIRSAIAFGWGAPQTAHHAL